MNHFFLLILGQNLSYFSDKVQDSCPGNVLKWELKVF